ncbi:MULTISPECIES: hypothetical protein [unclassified Okeania]|uniref:hypothetical protein n=1 Tax=unclassified Okeania TaxID=2634635 RepID=UPI0013C140CC|nr:MULTISPECIES: hypothetical protein [unclassified Okeania]NET29613.1 hypothetical protein [Okeania sp. SIO1I7]NET42710.1 hypothetical protein [Okeania sp. SIO2B3]
MNKQIFSIVLVNFALAVIGIIPEITSNLTNVKLDKLQSEDKIQSELIAQREPFKRGDSRTDRKSEEK